MYDFLIRSVNLSLNSVIKSIRDIHYRKVFQIRFLKAFQGYQALSKYKTALLQSSNYSSRLVNE